jgi:hypothetical protein
MERYVAIDNVCAWPNLTLMPDGELIATIFNRPSHGAVEGDVECWASADGGRLWTLRGVPAPHEPGSNRMNVSAGLSADGALMVLASGWSMKEGTLDERIMPCWSCRSTDAGRTWQRTDAVAVPAEHSFIIPFGDIECLPDGTLASSFYTCTGGEQSLDSAYLMFSRDGGKSWRDPVLIGANDYNETDILRLRADRWLAAIRTQKDAHLELFVGKDEGRSWTRVGPVSLPSQHPAHLFWLADGRVLLTCGLRNPGLWGVAARLSNDEGETWGAPRLLVNLDDATDGGYPSSVQIEDGTIVTAYYANRIAAHRRYHMGVVRWRLDE